MTSVFEADPDFIASLDSISLVRLLKRLILAEARLSGIPLRQASIPLQVTIADGGEDGRVEWTGGGDSTAYFPARCTVFQSKAQTLSESQVKAEVTKRRKGASPTLKPAIADVLARRGAYVVFCHERMVTNKRKKLTKAIKMAIKEAGHSPKRASAIEIYDANLVADWVNTHPPVALWLASQKHGRNLAGFETHEAWGNSPNFLPPWQPSEEPRFVPTNQLIPNEQRKDSKRNAWTCEQAANQILNVLASERAIVRVFGPSGFGKSRFVYEMFRSNRNVADQIDSASVIYCDGSLSGEEAAKLIVQLADAGVSAIFVVDECSDELHLKLADRVNRPNSRLRLVTIEIETKVLNAPGTLAIRVEKADEGLIKAIAAGVAPNLGDRDKGFVADLADGFPRMAVLAAQEGGYGRQTFLSAAQILDRIIWSGKVRAPEAERALSAASLFEWIGIQGRVENEAAFVAQELAQISLPRFVEHLLSFKSRGVISLRGDFLQVGPVPLAVRMGLARLDVITRDQLLKVFEMAPAELRSSLLKRIRWLDTSPTAAAFAERLLEPDMVGNLAALNTEVGAKMLDRLLHLVPDLASATLDRVLGDLTPDELKSIRDGRRYLVWSLEKLVFRRQTFDSSARMLLKFAIAENEDIGNNATGIFKQLFHLYLSGTEAEPEARLLVLDEGLRSTNDVEREICIEALGGMLDSSGFSRSGGSEQIGSAEALEDWRPKTYGEIQDFFRAATSRLVGIATGNDILAPLAVRHLGTHIRGLLSKLPTDEVRSMIDAVTTCRGFWLQALGGISDWLYFDREKTTPRGVANKIRKMYDDLLPTDPIDLAELYTHGWQTDLHDPDATYAAEEKPDFEYGIRQAVALARQIADDPDLSNQAIERLACSDGHGVLPFTKELMKRIENPVVLFDRALEAAEADSRPPNRGCFSGLISGAAQRDPKIAGRLIRSALQSPKMRVDAIGIVSSGTLAADDIALAISLLESGDIKPWQFRNLRSSRTGIAELVAVLKALERKGSEGLWTILDLVQMYLYDSKNAVTKELVTLVKRVLITPALMDAVPGDMDGYNMERLVARVASLGAIDQTYAKKLASQLLRICRQKTDGVFYKLDDPVRKILGQLIASYPAATWAEIAKKLTSKSWYDRFYVEHLLERPRDEAYLSRGLAFGIPQDVYLNWVRENPKIRAAKAVAWFPIAEKLESGQLRWSREVENFIAEFGGDANVLPALARRLVPTSYWGGLAHYLEPIVPLVENWLIHPNAKVRSWATSEIAWLRKTIAAESKRSEEDPVRFR